MEIVKLKPALKDYLWGGTKLKKYKPCTLDLLAEAWEFSFHQDGLCTIDSGKDKGKNLKDVVKEDDLGYKVNNFPFMPFLIKLIDAKDNLSVQVHPSDEYALKYENSYGKEEMWHILDVEANAGLYIGLKNDITLDQLKSALENNSLLELLNFYQVKKGENYFIPSGTIHAIGKGTTLIEIQQNSNLTYRLYDYQRKDKNGNLRPLHIDKALAVCSLNKYRPKTFNGNCIGKSKYFASYIFHNDPEVTSSDDSFVTITFIEGEGTFNHLPFKKYDTFFIPANKKGIIAATSNYSYILTKVE